MERGDAAFLGEVIMRTFDGYMNVAGSTCSETVLPFLHRLEFDGLCDRQGVEVSCIKLQVANLGIRTECSRRMAPSILQRTPLPGGLFISRRTPPPGT